MASEYSHNPIGLEPFLPEGARILILGSFPSAYSRKVGFYYGNPANRFYKVLAALFQEDEPIGTSDREAFLSKHHIALSDAVHSCDILGSQDASIKNVVPNDIPTLLVDEAHNIRIQAVFNTGKKSAELYERYIKPLAKSLPDDLSDVLLHNHPLPSTSPLNASYSLDRLVGEYKVILDYAP